MIKKHNLLMAIFILTAGMTYAQSNKFELGISGGPNLAFLVGSNAYKEHGQAITGFVGGVFLQYNFTEHSSLRTNLFYEQKGTKYTYTYYSWPYTSATPMTDNMHFDYLTIPVLYRYTLGKTVQYFINAGPYTGILLREVHISNGDYETDHTVWYKRFDFGLSSGLGISIPFEKKFALSFEARDNFGLMNILENPGGSVTRTHSVNFLFSVAYKLSSK